MIGLTADAGDHFKKRASIPLAPCMLSDSEKINKICNFKIDNKIFHGHVACLKTNLDLYPHAKVRDLKLPKEENFEKNLVVTSHSGGHECNKRLSE
jgi:hypothetical protein